MKERKGAGLRIIFCVSFLGVSRQPLPSFSILVELSALESVRSFRRRSTLSLLVSHLSRLFDDAENGEDKRGPRKGGGVTARCSCWTSETIKAYGRSLSLGALAFFQFLVGSAVALRLCPAVELNART